VHFCLILDWEKMEEQWRKEGRVLTEEAYINEYISAQIPPMPDQNDRSDAANRQRDFVNLIVNQHYHTCDVGRCKENAGDACQKGFPVNIKNSKKGTLIKTI